MSWSVYGTGKAPALLASIAKQFENSGACIEPEEGVRQAAKALLGEALGAQGSNTVLKVIASGHQMTDYTTKAVSNQVQLSVEVLNGFVE